MAEDRGAACWASRESIATPAFLVLACLSRTFHRRIEDHEISVLSAKIQGVQTAGATRSRGEKFRTSAENNFRLPRALGRRNGLNRPTQP